MTDEFNLKKEMKDIENSFILSAKLNESQLRILRQVFIDIENQHRIFIKKLKEELPTFAVISRLEDMDRIINRLAGSEHPGGKND